MADNIFRMQQEAAQRVQRMQQMARQLVEDDRKSPPPPREVSPPPPSPGGETMSPARQPARRVADDHRPAPTSHHAPGRTAESLAANRPPESPPRKPEALEKREDNFSLNALLGGLTDDPERLLLLLLAILLVKNGAQTELILSLLYIAI